MVQAGWYADPSAQAELRWWDGQRWTAWTHPPAADAVHAPPRADAVRLGTRRSGSGLEALLGDVDRIAVVDVETTGVYSNDRVVEVGVVTVDRSGAIVDEFECLINPLRDPGPTWLHGLTPSILQDAPMFEDVALHLAALLDGAVVAAHNLSFDRRLLQCEFERAGVDIDWGHGLDTLRAVGCKLGVACANYGIQLHGAHCALNDARATAQLLLRVADSFDTCRPAVAYPLSGEVPRVLTREGFTSVDIERPYVLQLARGVHSTADLAPYVTLLDYAVADLKFDIAERRELALLAQDLGLSEHSRVRAHKEFLNSVIDAALDDGVVTDDEFDQLSRIAALLDVDDAVVSSRTNPYRLAADFIDLTPGLQVCFTGAALQPNGEPLERDELDYQARLYGLETVDSVTKKNCGLLVAADPASMSTKAKSAQKFGIPVATVSDFLLAINSGSRLQVLRLPANGVALVCIKCGYSWMASRRKSDPVCDDCRGVTTKAPVAPSGADNGRNFVNVADREDRLGRCRQAVELQAGGASRREIAAMFGVGEEAVKAMLRDGKFYANPDADPQRLELAKTAASARVRGLTRAQYGDESRLSSGKADESWKDADVLFGDARTVSTAEGGGL